MQQIRQVKPQKPESEILQEYLQKVEEIRQSEVVNIKGRTLQVFELTETYLKKYRFLISPEYTAINHPATNYALQSFFFKFKANEELVALFKKNDVYKKYFSDNTQQQKIASATQ